MRLAKNPWSPSMSIQANDPRVPSEASAQSLPLGNFFGRRLAVSYSVPFAFAFVAGVIAIFASGPGNQDLIKASALACLVWVLGWGGPSIVLWCLL